MTSEFEFEKEALSAPTGPGICATCPIRSTCALKGDGYTTCPVTGSVPPAAPPPAAPPPAPVPPVEPEPVAESARGWDPTAVASRGLETAIGAVTGFGWLEVVAGLVERLNKDDADGNPVDWSRLQLARNGLCVALVCIPLGDGPSAAGHVADLIATHGIGSIFVPLGYAVAIILPPLLCSYVPGLMGLIGGGIWSAMTAIGRGVLTFCRSRLGWIITRPLIWSVVVGFLFLAGRPIIRILTGA